MQVVALFAGVLGVVQLRTFVVLMNINIIVWQFANAFSITASR
jgi:hypothetical protein